MASGCLGRFEPRALGSDITYGTHVENLLEEEREETQHVHMVIRDEERGGRRGKEEMGKGCRPGLGWGVEGAGKRGEGRDEGEGRGLPLIRNLAPAHRLHNDVRPQDPRLTRILLGTDSTCVAIGPWGWLGATGSANNSYLEIQPSCCTFEQSALSIAQ